MSVAQRWNRDVVSNKRRTEKDWILWHVLSNRFIDSIASKYPGINIRQVRRPVGPICGRAMVWRLVCVSLSPQRVGTI